MTMIKRGMITSDGEDVEEPEPQHIAADNVNIAATLENSLAFTIRPSNSIPRYTPKRNENIGPYKNLHMNIYSSFITTAKEWKQFKCPSLAEQINKMWHTHTMEYNLAIKRNKALIHDTTWMTLKTYAE